MGSRPRRMRSGSAPRFAACCRGTDNTLTSHRQPGESGRQCSSILADRQDRVWAGFSQRRRRPARARPRPRAHRAGRPRTRLGVADRAGQRRRRVVRHVGRREPLPERSLHVRHHGACAHHRGRPDAGRGYPGLRVGGRAVGRRADALPCGRDGQDREGAPPPSRLHALRRERWTAARHADVAERRRRRARHGRADLGRQRAGHDDHRPAATARSAPCVAAEPGGRHRQRRARQPGGRPAVRERQHGADRVRRPQPLGDVEAALPPPARRRRRGLGVRRGRPARHLRQPAGRRLSIPRQHHGGRAVDRAVAVGVHRRSAVLSEPLVSHRRRHGAGRRDRRGREAARPGGQDPLRAGDRRAHAPEPRDPRHAAPEPGRARPRARGAGDARPVTAKAA